LGGALGAALLQQLLDRRWLMRTRTTRMLQLTPQGSEGLYHAFGIRPR
jgi:hypothetical protein